ncbi:MAG: ABC transporter permease [Akkermansiaceae bacterium]|nr:ABC transporter permease [Akkermansiaceae bacterium]MDP4647834.1 ABC transporter permease [Akkermansiaceae bacterium]MDP4779078.1 ABC transporter permease [Akkermansiaceae bacterium]MDP4845936.1 ABC transporter permease [Akkermansiaceae bacterium]MDP4897775.1 ABC transporter permease [Akkermansiaceae bacterium]
MLARRYLNPRRAVLSSFTLISLVGVMLGVLVLVVVMAVFAGLERDVKDRLLGFTPHILVRPLVPIAPGEEDADTPGWQVLAAEAAKIKGVAAATAYVSDNVILDVESWQRPVSFRGIDTTDAAQVKGVEDMLDMEGYPDSTADMGIDDRAVISSIIAAQFQLQVGDTMRLYSTRNFEGVMDAYKATENPVVREAYPEEWALAKKIFGREWQKDGEIFIAPSEELFDVYPALEFLYNEEIREPERELLEDLLSALGERIREEDEPEGIVFFRYTAAVKADIDEAFKALSETDQEKLDGEILKGLKGLVLPKEAVVVGIYAGSQMVMTPDLFMPLPLSQDLAGLGDQVQGIALRLDEPYDADKVAVEVRKKFGGDNYVETWGEQYEAFFLLINQQRVMMYFALSFIVLVSAFSMMAVMFTVTIQKKREIGVMKALGAAPGQIVRVFLYQGMLLGLLGALLGVGLGRVVIEFRGVVQEGMRALGFDPFSASLTGFGVIPAYNNPVEQLAIGFIAFVLCSLAALVPAFFAARSDAAKSLRNL